MELKILFGFAFCLLPAPPELPARPACRQHHGERAHRLHCTRGPRSASPRSVSFPSSFFGQAQGSRALSCCPQGLGGQPWSGAGCSGLLRGQALLTLSLRGLALLQRIPAGGSAAVPVLRPRFWDLFILG